MTANSTLTAFFTNWEKYQENLTQALAPLTNDQLALRAAPNLRSISELARHIIVARCGWFHQALGEGSEEIAQMAQWDQAGQPTRSAEELVRALEKSWSELKSAMEGWTPEDFAGTVTPIRGGKTYTFTREYIIWHLIEHDLHHGGELALTLGMNGLKAPEI